MALFKTDHCIPLLGFNDLIIGISLTFCDRTRYFARDHRGFVVFFERFVQKTMGHTMVESMHAGSLHMWVHPPMRDEVRSVGLGI